MLNQDELDLLEELAYDDAEPLETLPEVRHYLDAERRGEEGGLRTILESPEALEEAWRRVA